MSILLKDVPMPENCIECPCSEWDGIDELYCHAYLQPTQANGIPDYCKMVEVEDAWYSHHPHRNIYVKLQ